jgi:hypothetical protein
MDSIKIITTTTPDAEIPRVFQTIARGFIITAPCIICQHQLVIVANEYSLLEFYNNGEIKFRTVTFVNVLQEGLKLKIFVLDMKEKKLLQCTHYINESTCNWVLTDLFQSKQQLLNDEHDLVLDNNADKKSDDTLLEFDFSESQ